MDTGRRAEIPAEETLLLFSCQVMSSSFETPMDYSLPGSSVHGIFQASMLEWVAISFLRGSSQLKDRTHISCIGGKTREVPETL